MAETRGAKGNVTSPNSVMNATLYATFMEEVKQRSEAITASLKAIKDGDDSIAPYMRAEFAFLQLRYICELLTLSSLAAHYSMGLGSRLLKAWNPGEAFALLAKINPYCFPSSIRNVPDSKGVHNFHLVEGPTSLKRSDLAKIYAGCGNLLHRGLIKDLTRGQQREYDLAQLNAWHRDVMDLLQQHIILIRNPDRTLLVNFYSDDGHVAVYEAEAVDPIDLTPEQRDALDV